MLPDSRTKERELRALKAKKERRPLRRRAGEREAM